MSRLLYAAPSHVGSHFVLAHTGVWTPVLLLRGLGAPAESFFTRPPTRGGVPPAYLVCFASPSRRMFRFIYNRRKLPARNTRSTRPTRVTFWGCRTAVRRRPLGERFFVMLVVAVLLGVLLLAWSWCWRCWWTVDSVGFGDGATVCVVGGGDVTIVAFGVGVVVLTVLSVGCGGNCP